MWPILRRHFVSLVILACQHALLLSPAATAPKQLFAPSWPAMSNVETIGSSEWPTFGPPSSWSIDQQLEWIIDNTTVEVSEAQEPAQSLYTRGTDAEIIDDDGEDETETVWAASSFPFARRSAG